MEEYVPKDEIARQQRIKEAEESWYFMRS